MLDDLASTLRTKSQYPASLASSLNVLPLNLPKNTLNAPKFLGSGYFSSSAFLSRTNGVLACSRESVYVVLGPWPRTAPWS